MIVENGFPISITYNVNGPVNLQKKITPFNLR